MCVYTHYIYVYIYICIYIYIYILIKKNGTNVVPYTIEPIEPSTFHSDFWKFFSTLFLDALHLRGSS